MDKRRLRVVVKVLNQVKAQFPVTEEFMEEPLEEECNIENISAGNVIFLFTCAEAES